jgi:hypothetical protein
VKFGNERPRTLTIANRATLEYERHAFRVICLLVV